jgi:DNA-binding response OmpR family regulator
MQPTVLVVEDDPWTRTIVTALLASEGFAVLEASAGEQALRIARATLPDTVLLDLALPTKSGLDVLRELKDDHATRGIPVIVLSAYGSLMRDADVQLTEAVIDKPFDYDHLLGHVERTTGRTAARALAAS